MRLTPTEAEIQQAILQGLAAKRIFAGRLNTGTGFAGGRPVQHHSFGKGTADILAFPLIGLINTKFPTPLWIECKTAKGIQSPEQQSFASKVQSDGHDYLVARSWDDVEEWLRKHGL